ncbi:MAG: hypothetical protein AAGD25_14905 [Cyanobacteria bacterium P01_F01_bin.150]
MDIEPEAFCEIGRSDRLNNHSARVNAIAHSKTQQRSPFHSKPRSPFQSPLAIASITTVPESRRSPRLQNPKQ